MTPSQKSKPKPAPVITRAVTIRRVDSHLVQAFELTLEDGVVVSEQPLNSPNMPAYGIGAASKILWNILRTASQVGESK